MARDPSVLASPNEPSWTAVLINPTVGQMNAAVEMLRFAVKANGGEWAPPIKIVGYVPETWICPEDVAVNRPPGVTTFKQLEATPWNVTAVGAPAVPQQGKAMPTLEDDPDVQALLMKGIPNPTQMRGAEIANVRNVESSLRDSPEPTSIENL